MAKKFFPIKITDEAMEHIHSHAGRGHIEAREIIEVIRSDDSVPYRNKKEGRADYVVRGRAVSGKRLLVYVMLTGAEGYESELITAMVEDN